MQEGVYDNKNPHFKTPYEKALYKFCNNDPQENVRSHSVI